MTYSTLVGGSGTDTAEAIAIDATGNVLIAGGTSSADFPLIGQGVRGDMDAFVAQLNAAGTALIFSTYIGGSAADTARAVAFDGTGNVLITGTTASSNFPLAASTQAALSGTSDAFITKLNPSGTALVYSTYLGGSAAEESWGIAVNQATGEAFIAGDTRSANLPTTAPYKATLTGMIEGLVAKFGPTGARLFSTYWGGAGFPPSGTHVGVSARGIALDSTGNPVFTGTGGAVLPVTAGAAVPAGSETFVRGYIAKLSANGSTVLLCTYTQGALIFPRAVAVDGSNRIYITGHYQFAFNETPSVTREVTDDVFWAVLSADGTSFTASGDLVANNEDQAHDIALFGTEPFIYISGYTKSSNFPKNNVIPGTPGTVTGTEAFAVKINPNTRENVFVTLLGGSADDVATGIAVSSAGTFVAGYTQSTGPIGTFPTTVGALRRTGVGFDSFVVKLLETPCTYSLSAPSFAAPTTGGSSSVNVTTTCTWTATTAAAWITITTPSGTGNGTVSFTVTGNGTGAARSGSITIGDQVFAVTQDAAVCTFTLAPASQSLGGPAGSGSFNVTASAAYCEWTPSTATSWIALTSTAKVTGSGSVAYGTAPNSGAARSGTITAGGQTFTVNQAAAGCTFSIAPTAASSPLAGGAGSFTVTASGAHCDWAPATSTPWITLQSTALVLGSGTVNYTVAANAGAARSGTITAGGATFTVNQTGVVTGCIVTLRETSADVPATGAIRPIPITVSSPDCSVTATSNVTWIKVFTVSTYVELTIDTNTAATARTGTVTIGGQTYTVNQAAGGVCVFTLSATSANVGFDGALAGIEVNLTVSDPTCGWVSTSPVFWAAPSPRTGSGNARFLVTVIPNFSTQTRTTTVAIAGQNFVVTETLSTDSENHRFVRLLYFSYFGRTATVAEVQFHVNNLLGGQLRPDLVINFANSAEFNLGGRFIAGLYVGLMNRDAEYPGWQFQRNALVAGGTSPPNLTTAFLGSAEFAARFGTLANDNYVRHLYRYVLLREASQTDVDFHVGTLSPTLTRAQMAINFLYSPEFQAVTSPRLFAFLVSAALQLRDPTTDERISRLQQLQGGTPQKTLVETALTTAAFRVLLD